MKNDLTQNRHYFVPLEDDETKYYASCNVEVNDNLKNTNRLLCFILFPEFGSRKIILEVDEDKKLVESGSSLLDHHTMDAIKNTIFNDSNSPNDKINGKSDYRSGYLFIPIENETNSFYAVANRQFAKEEGGSIPTGIFDVYLLDPQSGSKEFEIFYDSLRDKFEVDNSNIQSNILNIICNKIKAVFYK